MKKTIFLVFLVCLIASCGNKSGKLNFTSFEIKDENGVTGISVKENGEISTIGQQTGKVERNGEIKDMAGKMIAKINDSNILVDAADKPLIKINENGEMDNGSGILIKWNEKGELIRGNEKAGFLIKPYNKNNLQTASIVLYMYLGFK